LWQGTKGAYCPSTLILDYPWAIIRDEMRGCRLLLKSAHVRVGAQQSLLGPAYTQELGTIHGAASAYNPPLAAQRRRSTVPNPAVPKPKKTIAKVRASPSAEMRQTLKVQAAYFRQYQRRVEREDWSGAEVSAGFIGKPGQLDVPAMSTLGRNHTRRRRAKGPKQATSTGTIWRQAYWSTIARSAATSTETIWRTTSCDQTSKKPGHKKTSRSSSARSTSCGQKS
jgi:hypothetical protein